MAAASCCCAGCPWSVGAEALPASAPPERGAARGHGPIDELRNDPLIHLSVDFRPGDIQLLHNHQVLHSRGDFENWPEPERHRHLLRLCVAPPEVRPLRE